jgi:hypothetical protein
VHSFAAMEAPNRLALQLDAEISCVITAMRQNAKWAVVPGKYNVRHTKGPLAAQTSFDPRRRPSYTVLFKQTVCFTHAVLV